MMGICYLLYLRTLSLLLGLYRVERERIVVSLESRNIFKIASVAYFNTYYSNFLEVQMNTTKYTSQDGAVVEPSMPQ
jgi:hypothetical protein